MGPPGMCKKKREVVEMNRGERRAKSRKPKGGCGVSVSFGRGSALMPQDMVSPVLEYCAELGKEERRKKVLRSKQVPGY
jgi:hypothetical protein